MPSTGSDAYALCVTLDKALTKKHLADLGVPSPRGRFVTRASLKTGGLDELQFPVIVKPNFEGSSKGIDQESVVESPASPWVRARRRSSPRTPTGRSSSNTSRARRSACAHRGPAAACPPVETIVDPHYPRRFDIIDYRLAHRSTRASSAAAPARPSPEVVGASARPRAARGFRRSRCATWRRSISGSARMGEVWFLSATAIPSFEPRGALFVAATAPSASTTTRRCSPSCAPRRSAAGFRLCSTRPRRGRLARSARACAWVSPST